VQACAAAHNTVNAHPCRSVGEAAMCACRAVGLR